MSRHSSGREGGEEGEASLTKWMEHAKKQAWKCRGVFEEQGRLGVGKADKG